MHHPFNEMLIRPSRMRESMLIHTMFEADYILKELTVGSEVQRMSYHNDPNASSYEQRNIEALLDSTLSETLKVGTCFCVAGYTTHQTIDSRPTRF